VKWFVVILTSLLVFCSEPIGANPAALSQPQAALLAQWFDLLGEPSQTETFGDFLARAASIKRHSPYQELDETIGPERLHVDLARFDCLSLIDTSLAVARCAWIGAATEACFVKELIATRYRHGVMKGFTSRLHYLVDWLDDNRERHRLDDLTRDLGGILLRRHFAYMSEHENLYPPMSDPEVREAIARTEARLSQQIYAVIVWRSVIEKEHSLMDGDLVGIVTRDTGRLIGHAGLVLRDSKDKAQLLHASSYHRSVVLTRTSLADYVSRRRDRWGIMIARPRAPDSRNRLTTSRLQR
jgi:hypothetical protein